MSVCVFVCVCKTKYEKRLRAKRKFVHAHMRPRNAGLITVYARPQRQGGSHGREGVRECLETEIPPTRRACITKPTPSLLNARPKPTIHRVTTYTHQPPPHPLSPILSHVCTYNSTFLNWGCSSSCCYCCCYCSCCQVFSAHCR